jgi:hypothetical protein
MLLVRLGQALRSGLWLRCSTLDKRGFEVDGHVLCRRSRVSSNWNDSYRLLGCYNTDVTRAFSRRELNFNQIGVVVALLDLHFAGVYLLWIIASIVEGWSVLGALGFYVTMWIYK